MSPQVVYDNLRYYMTFDNEVMVEGYEGFRVEENYEGKFFIVYKEIVEQRENERRFVLPDGTLDSFLDLAKLYGNFFEKQKYLFRLMIEAEQRLTERCEDVLKEICNAIYTIPQNYIHFVAMNLTKSQFFIFAKERILNQNMVCEMV